MNKYLALVLAALPPFLKPYVLRMFGMKVGRNVRIGFGVLLICRKIDLGDGVSIGNFTTIRADHLQMGPRSKIGNSAKFTVHTLIMKSQSTIDGQTIINGDTSDPRSSIYMGPASWVFPFCFLDASRSIKLGKNVGVGGSSYLFTHGRWLSKLDGFPVSFGDIVIGDDVWIPWRCFIMPGVNIGSRTIIAACSVVTKNVPDGALAAGAPARIVRDKSNVDMDEEQRITVLREISQSFAEKLKCDLVIDCKDGVENHLVGDQHVISIHPDGFGIHQSGAALNVIKGSVIDSDARTIPLWSLLDYTSSPLSSLSDNAKNWLTHARLFGVRFYPVDEDLQ